MGDSGKRKRNTWPIKVVVISILLTIIISLISDTVIGGTTNIFVIISVLLTLVTVGIISDIIGVAVTSADSRPFVSMAAKKVPGAQRGLWLIRNADRVSSMCNDVIGDICSIVSGAAGAALVVLIITALPGAGYTVVSIGVSAIIAGLTIGFKALGKNAAIRYSRDVVLLVGHLLRFFPVNGKNGQRH